MVAVSSFVESCFKCWCIKFAFSKFLLQDEQQFHCVIQKHALQSKLKAMASKGSASVITEDVLKGQDSLTTDTGQPAQPEEMPSAAGAEQMEREDDFPQQADDLSFSLDELNVMSPPESSTVCPNQDYNLVNSLLNLTKSPVSGFLCPV